MSFIFFLIARTRAYIIRKRKTSSSNINKKKWGRRRWKRKWEAHTMRDLGPTLSRAENVSVSFFSRDGALLPSVCTANRLCRHIAFKHRCHYKIKIYSARVARSRCSWSKDDIESPLLFRETVATVSSVWEKVVRRFFLFCSFQVLGLYISFHE